MRRDAHRGGPWPLIKRPQERVAAEIAERESEKRVEALSGNLASGWRMRRTAFFVTAGGCRLKWRRRRRAEVVSGAKCRIGKPIKRPYRNKMAS
jgi:hypothetical protein